MYFLYSLIYTIALIFIFPYQYLKRPKTLRKRWLREKFGFFNLELRTQDLELIWVHAVSVGEVMAALPLLKKFKESYPSKDIILSTITDTGRKVAQEGAPEGTTVVYLPFDIPLILNAVIKKIRPEILIVIETELWPNMFRRFKKKGIPIVVFNGRISENSLRGYKRISFFMKRALSHVDIFGMQDKVYAERIRSMGVESERVMVLGNFKFDTKPPSRIPEWTEKIKGPVIVAGSTHEGEEEFITFMYSELKKNIPDVNLIIVPRHPERFKEVGDMLASKGIPFIKRSEMGTLSAKADELGTFRDVIILLDSIGELSAIYGIADIAIIGKSFRGYGGQNPLEPAYWGKPIVCGPHMENFPIIKDFYTEGAAIEVNEEMLCPTLKKLLMSPEMTKEIGLKAQELYKKNAGAVERAMEVISRYISK
ncbi:MAG: 3-deoxy-D-manno-octulosonic acid transferase [Nitrospirota bacterium]|nr:3-deoxy-D-manno-octulosonic acid transferase [Nitrospirota bacterium]